jgi:hypothetical protein
MAAMSELFRSFRATRFSEVKINVLADFFDPFHTSDPIFPKVLPKHFMQIAH